MKMSDIENELDEDGKAQKAKEAENYKKDMIEKPFTPEIE